MKALRIALLALVASAAFGAQQVINVGSSPADSTGDNGRTAFQKVNANFTDLYTNWAPLLSPALIGNPTAPTQLDGDNSTKIATTAYVDRKTPFPSTIATYTILCNNTNALAAPIQCKFSNGTLGNMGLVVGNFDPSVGSLASTHIYNTAFGVGALNALTNVSGTQGNTAFGYNALLSGTTITQEDAFGKLALRDDVEGTFNSAFGSAAMRCFTGTGAKQGNVAFGHGALAGDDALCSAVLGGSPGTYSGVTAIGAWSLQELTTGNSNTCVGESSCLNVSTGIDNTSMGFYVGPCADTVLATSGRPCAGASNNAFFGFHAGQVNQANSLAGFGMNALSANTTGIENTAVGFNSLAAITTGNGDTAVGFSALAADVGAGPNTAVGDNALKVLTTGIQNTCVGGGACKTQTTVNSNTALGAAALNLATGGNNTAIGDHAGAVISSGTKNTIVGNNVASTTLQTGSGNIIIGTSSYVDAAAAGTNNTLVIEGESPAVPSVFCTAINTSTPTCSFGGAQVVSGGKITPASTVGIVGTTAADRPAAGSVGEVASINCPVTAPAAAATSVTITIATPAVVTWSSHTFVPSSGLANYTCPINFLGTPPTGISVGTTYYIIGSSVSGDTFQISDTAANALAGTNAVATSGSDGGTTAYLGVLATTATLYNAAGIKLVAGDWDCTDVGEFQELTSITSSRYATGLSTGSATLPAIGLYTDNRTVSGAVGAFNTYMNAPVVQQNISSTTSIFAITTATWSAGTMNQSSFIRCRRMR